MTRAGAGHPAGQNLSPIGEITAKGLYVLIVDELYFIGAEPAELSSLKSSWSQCDLLSAKLFIIRNYKLSLKWFKIGRFIRRSSIAVGRIARR